MRGAAGALAGALIACSLASVARAAPSVAIDGPSAGVVSLGGVALAPDGGGAIVYTKLAAGVPHVFVALERAGAWAAPVQVDSGLTTPASAPSVAVADGGRVAVVWISGGTLYGTVEAARTAAFTAPQGIASASGTPALGMSISGTAYVAYLGSGFELDVARLDRRSTSFAVLPGAESPGPIELASAGGGPAITVAADATAAVAWAALQPDGTTHVFVRRISAAGPSPVLDDATVTSLNGATGGSADSPVLGVAYDSSVVWLAFRETVGGAARVVVNELLGDELRAKPTFADSLGAASGPASAAAPSLAINGRAQGLLACGLEPSNALSLATHGFAGAPPGWSPGAVLGAASNPVAPGPVSALSADGSGLVAFSPSAGVLDGELVRHGSTTALVPLSNATLGPVVPADGLAAAADDHGDLLVAYVAGSPGALAIAADPIVAAPGAPRALGTQLWTADRRPVLRWQASGDHWAPPTYAVYLDGRRMATTTTTSYALPAEVPDGRHSWKVVAADAAGQQTSSETRRLLIDAAPPALRLSVAGARKARSTLTFTVRVSAISGVRAVAVDYGDGHTSMQLRSTHGYANAGSYAVSVLATDRAGVGAHLRVHVRIR